MHACTKVPTPDELVDAVEGLCRRHHLKRPCLLGRGLHSSTSRLNLSRFSHSNTPYTYPKLALNYPCTPLNNPITRRKHSLNPPLHTS